MPNANNASCVGHIIEIAVGVTNLVVNRGWCNIGVYSHGGCYGLQSATGGEGLPDHGFDRADGDAIGAVAKSGAVSFCLGSVVKLRGIAVGTDVIELVGVEPSSINRRKDRVTKPGDVTLLDVPRVPLG